MRVDQISLVRVSARYVASAGVLLMSGIFFSACGDATQDDGPGSCQVDGFVFPDGATQIPLPGDCNRCSCDDGMITFCTGIACPIVECSSGSVPGIECIKCGPADTCEEFGSDCLQACSSTSPCEVGVCEEGVCRKPCG